MSGPLEKTVFTWLLQPSLQCHQPSQTFSPPWLLGSLGLHNYGLRQSLLLWKKQGELKLYVTTTEVELYVTKAEAELRVTTTEVELCVTTTEVEFCVTTTEVELCVTSAEV